jgi:hypothetical protein
MAMMRFQLYAAQSRLADVIGAFVVGVVMLGISHCALATTINFDNVINAPTFFTDAVPGGAFGPAYYANGVSFSDGVVLDGDGYDNEEPTPANLYATTSIYSLADGSDLSGYIEGTLDTPGFYNGISLDIINGFLSGSFTLSAYDAANNLVDSDTLSLGEYGSSTAVGTATIWGSNIDYFTITSATLPDDFGIDSIELSYPAPEKSTGQTFAVFLALAVAVGLFSSKGIKRKSRS